MLKNRIPNYMESKKDKRIDIPEELFDFLISYHDKKKDGTKKEQALKGLEKVLSRLFELDQAQEDGKMILLDDDASKKIKQLLAFDVCEDAESCLHESVGLFFDAKRSEISAKLGEE